jgi:hypothetical protein
MGQTRGPYQADFPEGTRVRVAGRDVLESLMRPAWAFHHPVTPRMLECADRTAIVREVGYYHGGDELYELIGVPGLWHERCLAAVDPPAA